MCVITVDSSVMFFALNGVWQPVHLSHGCKKLGKFENLVVTVHMLSESPPAWLSKLYKLPELQFYHPSFNCVTACVAFCYGDESYKFQLEGSSALASLKKRKKEFLNRSSLAADGHSDPKNFWSAERTLHSWLHASVFLALSSQSLQQTSKIGAICLSVAAIALALYSVARWSWRNHSLKRGVFGAFVDRIAPMAVAMVIVAFLVASVVLI